MKYVQLKNKIDTLDKNKEKCIVNFDKKEIAKLCDEWVDCYIEFLKLKLDDKDPLYQKLKQIKSEFMMMR